MAITREDVITDENLTVAVKDAARSLAQTLAKSSAMRSFEAAQEAFMSDKPLQRQLQQLQARQQQIRLSRMWNGADRKEEEKLEAEWDRLAQLPLLQSYLRAQDELRAFLQEITGTISREVGVDFGAACSPAGGCC
jgi:cell fate (sporulation/competence/biofilm development) regulator YlbF (YheA/YmcA/DUF963 family)